MNISIYDPLPYGNEYASKLFFRNMRAFGSSEGRPLGVCENLDTVKNQAVVVLTDHLSEERIDRMKNNGCRIIGFNVTDSSYISGAIRYARNLQLVDKIFTLSGIPTTNEGAETGVDANMNVVSVPKPFLDEPNWKVFDYLRRSGKLISLPYCPWEKVPQMERQPWAKRSQKVIIRGGGHARRFLLALFLMRIDRLDINSGLILSPYFDDAMNPQFRFCDDCRESYRHAGKRVYDAPFDPVQCNSPARTGSVGWDLSDLGQWNNRCPKSFFWMAEQFEKRHGPVDIGPVETMLNARWLSPHEHLGMLGRILFTSDLKWEHSIFMPQRFWEGASAGCINLLPQRTTNQQYFPDVKPGLHYLVYEDATFKNLELASMLDERSYNQIAGDARAVFDHWIDIDRFGINTNLLDHIFLHMDMTI